MRLNDRLKGLWARIPTLYSPDLPKMGQQERSQQFRLCPKDRNDRKLQVVAVNLYEVCVNPSLYCLLNMGSHRLIITKSPDIDQLNNACRMTPAIPGDHCMNMYYLLERHDSDIMIGILENIQLVYGTFHDLLTFNLRPSRQLRERNVCNLYNRCESKYQIYLHVTSFLSRNKT